MTSASALVEPRTRAANYPKPLDWVEPADAAATEHSSITGQFLAASQACYFSDTSEYQTYYNKTYPYPVASFRFCNGSRADYKAPANWAYHRLAMSTGHTRILRVYCIFQPGQLQTTLNVLHSIFGAKCPTDRLIIVVDMESGSQFAGSGNHSAEANQWAAAFASYTGSWARVEPYANVPDFGACWPQLDSRLNAGHRHVANYSASAPSLPHLPWQYYGALNYPTPAGAPRSCAPFGSYVDMNVYYQTIDQLELMYGITKPVPPKPVPPAVVEEDDMFLAIVDTTGAGTGTGYYLVGGPDGGYSPILGGTDINNLANLSRNTANPNGLVTLGSIAKPFSFAQHQKWLGTPLAGIQDAKVVSPEATES